MLRTCINIHYLFMNTFSINKLNIFFFQIFLFLVNKFLGSHRKSFCWAFQRSYFGIVRSWSIGNYLSLKQSILRSIVIGNYGTMIFWSHDEWHLGWQEGPECSQPMKFKRLDQPRFIIRIEVRYSNRLTSQRHSQTSISQLALLVSSTETLVQVQLGYLADQTT